MKDEWKRFDDETQDKEVGFSAAREKKMVDIGRFMCGGGKTFSGEPPTIEKSEFTGHGLYIYMRLRFLT